MPLTLIGFSFTKGIFGEDFEKNEYSYDDIRIIVTLLVDKKIEAPAVDVRYCPNGNRGLEVVLTHWLDIAARKEIGIHIGIVGTLGQKPRTKVEERSATSEFTYTRVRNFETKIIF